MMASAPSLQLTVTGTSLIYRRAERDVLTIGISSEGISQEQVSQDVTATTSALQDDLERISPKAEFEKTTKDKAITHWFINSLSTWSQVCTDDKGQPLGRRYYANTRVVVRFQEFAELGPFVTVLSRKPHVNISGIEWRLTDDTQRSLASQSRKEAMVNAIQKAKDYATAASFTKVLLAVEVNDGPPDAASFPVHYQYGATRSAGFAAHGGAEQAQSLSFEPEDIQLKSDVTVKFVAQ